MNPDPFKKYHVYGRQYYIYVPMLYLHGTFSECRLVVVRNPSETAWSWKFREYIYILFLQNKIKTVNKDLMCIRH